LTQSLVVGVAVLQSTVPHPPTSLVGTVYRASTTPSNLDARGGTAGGLVDLVGIGVGWLKVTAQDLG
jgi:hypothetical protein